MTNQPHWPTLKVVAEALAHGFALDKTASSAAGEASEAIYAVIGALSTPSRAASLSGGEVWRTKCRVIVGYMPRFPRADTKPICAVHYPCDGGIHGQGLYLRYSKGPKTGTFWDIYPDDFLNERLALSELLKASPPVAGVGGGAEAGRVEATATSLAGVAQSPRPGAPQDGAAPLPPRGGLSEEAQGHIKFLTEAAKYFERQAVDSNEDRTHWAGVFNADNCLKAAEYIRRADLTPLPLGAPQGRCETTLTERFSNPGCKCDTYPGNLGPCRTYMESAQPGTCAYCAHGADCHAAVALPPSQPQTEPAPTPSGLEPTAGQGGDEDRTEVCNACGKEGPIDEMTLTADSGWFHRSCVAAIEAENEPTPAPYPADLPSPTSAQQETLKPPYMRDENVILIDAGIQPHVATVIEGMEAQADELVLAANAWNTRPALPQAGGEVVRGAIRDLREAVTTIKDMAGGSFDGTDTFLIQSCEQAADLLHKLAQQIGSAQRSEQLTFEIAARLLKERDAANERATAAEAALQAEKESTAGRDGNWRDQLNSRLLIRAQAAEARASAAEGVVKGAIDMIDNCAGVDRAPDSLPMMLLEHLKALVSPAPMKEGK